MSYDLMVFDPGSAPAKRDAFLKWFEKTAEWSETHSYDDPSVTTPALRAWFLEMIQTFPAMNGPYAAADDANEDDEAEDDDDEESSTTDYCIGKTVIYAGFAWSKADEAYAQAEKHQVGFYDVSSDEGSVYFPAGKGKLAKAF
ncbi:MAG TPA: hypothetical protein VEJ63_00235 [Planctomycetota bacterium]|nr:hypothetical protein [Planctomycetota bacterium]